MVYSINQDFLTASKIMRALNGNRSPIEPVQRLQDDFTKFLSYTLRYGTHKDQGLHYLNERQDDVFIAKLPLNQAEAIFVLSGMRLHDGISDVVIIKSTIDDRYVVISGDSLKKNLKDGVVAYSLPLAQAAEDEVVDLMKSYIDFSDAVKQRHTCNDHFDTQTARVEVAQLFNPVDDPYRLYTDYLKHLVFPEPETFLDKKVSDIAPTP